MNNNNNYGVLLNKDALLYRNYFKEMVKLLGVNVIYRAPRDSKTYTKYGEIDSQYCEPILVGCIFEEHPNQQTLKKLGWVHSLQDTVSIIHVPYDLEKIQVGALFTIPDAINPSSGNVFRVTRLSTIMIYPSSVTCELVPQYEDTFQPNQLNHKRNDFTVLSNDEEGEEQL